MSITVTDINELKGYIEGVMARADHHARNVQGVALALAGAIIWRKDNQSTIEVRAARDGGTANVLWVSIGAQRYAFSYNHVFETIEMRAGSQRGEVLESFSDRMPIAQIFEFFQSL